MGHQNNAVSNDMRGCGALCGGQFENIRCIVLCARAYSCPSKKGYAVPCCDGGSVFHHPLPSTSPTVLVFFELQKRLLLVCKQAVQPLQVDNTTRMMNRKANFCFEFNNGYVVLVDQLKRKKQCFD